MSNQSPYEQLGVTEESSFEEIQAARDRLFAQHTGDRKQLESVEAAYDAVLMERLRMRQEGKIKVPDRIRFPEKLVQAPSPAPSPTSQSSSWVQRLIDTPSPGDIWLPAGVLTALSVLTALVPSPNVLQIAWIAALGSSFYFLYRKEWKLGRAVLLGLLGLIVGFFVGSLFGGLLQPQLAAIALRQEVFATAVTFFILWLVSSFLR